MDYSIVSILLFITLFSPFTKSEPPKLDRPSNETEFIHGNSKPNCKAAEPAKGKQWAVLIAGSTDYENYRHQVRVSSFFFVTFLTYGFSIVFIVLLTDASIF